MPRSFLSRPLAGLVAGVVSCSALLVPAVAAQASSAPSFAPQAQAPLRTMLQAEVVEPTQAKVATRTENGWTQQFASAPSALAEAARVGVEYAPTTDLQPTGLYLPPNTELTITVSGVKANDPNGVPSVSIGAPDSQIDENDKKIPTRLTPLARGKNTVSDVHGGVVYIDFQSKTATPSTATLTFGDTAEQMATFTRGVTGEAAFQRQLDRLDAPFVELYGKKSMITVTRQALLKYRNEHHNQLLAALDRIITVENKVAGYGPVGAPDAPPAGVHHLIGFPKVIQGVGAYAWDEITVYPVPIQDNLLKVDGLRIYGFGPWHEIGHQHQQSAVLPSDLLEASVNTYALAAQRDFSEYGSVPRLRAVNSSGTSDWDDGMAALKTGVDKYSDLPRATWVLPFEQLRLAYGDDFFPDWHKVVRQQADDLLDPYTENGGWDQDARWQNVIYSTSLAAGADLADFWDAWGADVAEATRDRIDAAALPNPRVDPTTLRESNIDEPYYDDFPKGGLPARASIGGTDLTGLEPGKAGEITTTFGNKQAWPVYDVSMTLDLPDGWTATPTTASTFESVAKGKSVTTTWAVTVPEGTPHGEQPLASTATYSEYGKSYTIDADGTAMVLLDDAIDSSTLSVAAVSSEETTNDNAGAANALDGDPSTFWHTRWNTDTYPHSIEIDLGHTYDVAGLGYLPRQDESNSRIKDYEIYVSTDGTNWGDPVATGQFTTGTDLTQVPFDAATGRYLKLVGLSSQNGAAFG
ncbi:M60 family metallopeptidase, partial [Isoptericola sp. NPDC060282]|uniref:M60 family metallopeptidase n=2 Tax=unclassified Isoptericola TaxID=2623355 RepID=UPI0036682609